MIYNLQYSMEFLEEKVCLIFREEVVETVAFRFKLDFQFNFSVIYIFLTFFILSIIFFFLLLYYVCFDNLKVLTSLLNYSLKT
jgi:hypothetical protein